MEKNKITVEITTDIGPVGSVECDSFGELVQRKEMAIQEYLKILDNPIFYDLINIKVI